MRVCLYSGLAFSLARCRRATKAKGTDKLVAMVLGSLEQKAVTDRSYYTHLRHVGLIRVCDSECWVIWSC